eukprot:3079939-Rhodomonas_salina.2
MGTYRWLMTPCSVFLQLEDNSGLESRTDEFGIGSGANECMEILRIGNAALTSLRIGNADGISSCDKAKLVVVGITTTTLTSTDHSTNSTTTIVPGLCRPGNGRAAGFTASCRMQVARATATTTTS